MKKPWLKKFAQSPFPHLTFKFVGQNCAAKALAFSLHFVCRRDQNHHFNLTSKVKKKVGKDLKKRRETSLEIQSKELKENRRTTVSEQQSNWAIPAKCTHSPAHKPLKRFTGQ